MAKTKSKNKNPGEWTAPDSVPTDVRTWQRWADEMIGKKDRYSISSGNTVVLNHEGYQEMAVILYHREVPANYWGDDE